MIKARHVVRRALLRAVQLREACQVPRSPEMIALQEPAPLLPVSRPPPLALEAPTATLTATPPLRLTVPLTRPLPVDETRPPVTVKENAVA